MMTHVRGSGESRQLRLASRAMEMSALTMLGLAAAFCTTIAFLPQVIKTWRTRSTADISLVMFLVLVLGIVLWLIYGALLGDLPLVAANVVTLGLAGTILVLKIKHG
jgi:MtN3 and saliva related transmembrane protein